MIPRSVRPSSAPPAPSRDGDRAAGRSAPPAWRRELARAVRDSRELLDLVRVDPAALGDGVAARRAAEGFPVRVPRGFVERMRPGDPRDPLLLQVLATAREEDDAAGFSADPLGEGGTGPVPGVLHKYRGRALLVVTGACAVHCRYCFRRHFPYAEEGLPGRGWDAAVDYLASDPEIAEVILSGGDPLTLPDDRLADLALRLATVPHLRRLRVHTRLPVVLPERVVPALTDWLAGGRLRPVVVIHANHAREIDGAVAAAVGRLRSAGVPVLNQAVLLAGVNDSTDALADLSETLFDAGALPYYLHLLDPVRGASHFAVGEATARRLLDRLTARLPGYLVPRLVREVPGADAKVPLAAAGTATAESR